MLSNLVKRPLTEYGEIVQERLREMGKSQRWLCSEINKAKKISYGHLGETLRGGRSEDNYRDIVFKILGIEQGGC